MTELQQNRYDQLLRRVGDLKGGGSKVSEVLSELFPMFDVENLPAELYLLGGTELCFGGANLTGAAGERPGISLRNPTGSSKIITVTSAVLSTDVTQQINFGVNNTTLTNGVGTETFRDTRRGITARPTGQMRTESQVAIIGSTGQVRLTTGQPYTLEDPNDLAVLLGGFTFEIGATTIASTLLVTFFWRERVAEPSETNL